MSILKYIFKENNISLLSYYHNLSLNYAFNIEFDDLNRIIKWFDLFNQYNIIIKYDDNIIKLYNDDNLLYEIEKIGEHKYKQIDDMIYEFEYFNDKIIIEGNFKINTLIFRNDNLIKIQRKYVFGDEYTIKYINHNNIQFIKIVDDKIQIIYTFNENGQLHNFKYENILNRTYIYDDNNKLKDIITLNE